MIKINRFELDNGLKVLHVYDKNTPMVTLNTLYKVGAKDEDPNLTGLAHLMEHLMFSGSQNAPNFDKTINKAGGENNAWTSNDVTNFYDTLPADNIETALFLEADRMRGLNFDEELFRIQQKVVEEEFKERNLNRPYGDVQKLIRKNVFKKHPYKWLPIGKSLSHIEKITLEDVKQFFAEHYAPNNAILSVVGNLPENQIEHLVAKWYGDIEKHDIKKRAIAQEPRQRKPRKEEVTRDVPNDLIVKVYRTPSIHDKEYYICDFISDLLAYNESARLHTNLVTNTKKFEEIEAYIGNLEDVGLLYIQGRPSNGVGIEEANKLIDEEVAKLYTQEISDYEMNKIRHCYETDKLFPGTTDQIAADIARFEMLGDAELYNQQCFLHNSVTNNQIKEWAEKIFREENCTTLYYKKQTE